VSLCLTVALLLCLAGRPWPITLATGFGAGMAFAQCQFEFIHPALLSGQWLPVRPSPMLLLRGAASSPHATTRTHALRRTRCLIAQAESPSETRASS
jgi:hypothetical protein